ncbi:nucleoside triphosphate pyrophosphohydrolase ham1 [Agyrium rufum]|nr:nucleoside triphosphate pyrophosphohydrolase ham1 [Agyrium rufum]
MSSSQPTPPKTLHFITSNANKLAEVQAILTPSLSPSTAYSDDQDPPTKSRGIILTSKSLDLPEIQAASIEEVTRDKCLRAAEAVQGPVLVEDTCLCFNALHELPGPYIKWFLQALGLEGLNNMLAAYEDKSAQAVCTFAYAEGPGAEPVIFQGRTDGKIVPARGPGYFGWDSIFEYEGQTYAEMDKVEKNKISHRFKALEKLKAWLESEELETGTDPR